MSKQRTIEIADLGTPTGGKSSTKFDFRDRKIELDDFGGQVEQVIENMAESDSDGTSVQSFKENMRRITGQHMDTNDDVMMTDTSFMSSEERTERSRKLVSDSEKTDRKYFSYNPNSEMDKRIIECNKA